MKNRRIDKLVIDKIDKFLNGKLEEEEANLFPLDIEAIQDSLSMRRGAFFADFRALPRPDRLGLVMK